MATPVDQLQQAYTTHSGHGSAGSVVAVLAVITILGLTAAIIGRLCSGRSILGHDFQGWVETKCASCIDGRLDPLPPAVEELAQDAEEEKKEESVQEPPKGGGSST